MASKVKRRNVRRVCTVSYGRQKSKLELGFLMGVWVEGGRGWLWGRALAAGGSQAGAVGVSGHTCLVNSEPV